MNFTRTAITASALILALVSGALAQEENVRRAPAGVAATPPTVDPVVRDAAPATVAPPVSTETRRGNNCIPYEASTATDVQNVELTFPAGTAFDASPKIVNVFIDIAPARLRKNDNVMRTGICNNIGGDGKSPVNYQIAFFGGSSIKIPVGVSSESAATSNIRVTVGKNDRAANPTSEVYIGTWSGSTDKVVLARK